MEAVTGDGWQEDGYLLFGNKLSLHLTHVDAAGRVFQGGTAITQVFDDLLRPSADGIAWVNQNKLASRWIP